MCAGVLHYGADIPDWELLSPLPHNRSDRDWLLPRLVPRQTSVRVLSPQQIRLLQVRVCSADIFLLGTVYLAGGLMSTRYKER